MEIEGTLNCVGISQSESSLPLRQSPPQKKSSPVREKKRVQSGLEKLHTKTIKKLNFIKLKLFNILK